jgi:hypothetical protein
VYTRSRGDPLIQKEAGLGGIDLVAKREVVYAELMRQRCEAQELKENLGATIEDDVKVKVFTVFHGTNREQAESIIQTGFEPNLSPDPEAHWYGNGSYFTFDLDNALSRCKFERLCPLPLRFHMCLPRSLHFHCFVSDTIPDAEGKRWVLACNVVVRNTFPVIAEDAHKRPTKIDAKGKVTLEDRLVKDGKQNSSFLKGYPLQPGYDLHFVVTNSRLPYTDSYGDPVNGRQQFHQVRSWPKQLGPTCQWKEDLSDPTKTWTELVVGDPSQILIRSLLCFTE